MPLPYFPHQGEVLICDFDDVALGAEMIKRRPVVVVSRHDSHNRRLCSVVPLSTTAPKPPRMWHHHMPHLSIPGWPESGDCWAKCDMLQTVSFDRLNKPYQRTRHGRNYITLRLDPSDIGAIQVAIRAYLGL